MIYKLLKANYVNKNNISYSEECIDKMIEQYKDKKFNVYCAEDVDFLEFNDESDFYRDKTIYGEISNLRKEDDYLICDLEFDKDKLKNISYNKFYLDSIYLAKPTYKDYIGELRTTLKSGGFFFLLHRQCLQSQATNARQCRGIRLHRGLFQPLSSFSRTKQFYVS